MRYSAGFNYEAFKGVMKTAFKLGQWYTGKPREVFAQEVKPIVNLVSKVVSRLDPYDFMPF